MYKSKLVITSLLLTGLALAAFFVILSAAAAGLESVAKPAAPALQLGKTEQAQPLAVPSLQEGGIDDFMRSENAQVYQQQAADGKKSRQSLERVNRERQEQAQRLSVEAGITTAGHLQRAQFALLNSQQARAAASSVYLPHPVYSPPVKMSPAPSAAFNITLESVHLNNYNGLSSSLIITNTGASAGDFYLDFYWPNDIYAGSYGPINLNSSQGASFNMQSANLPNPFIGKVKISSDQSIEAEITSPEYGSIQGRVFMPDGSTPLSGVGVSTRHFTNHGWYLGGTDSLSDGRYYFGGLQAMDYIVFASPSMPYAKQFYHDKLIAQEADPVTVNSGAAATGIDFTLHPGGTIQGTVYAADGVTPLENINVDLDQGWFGTCTDQNGHYLIENIPYGEHKVEASRDWNWCLGKPDIYAREYYNEATNSNDATLIPINSGQSSVSGIDFTLDVGGSIKGRVTIAASGQPLADTLVGSDFFYQGNNWNSTRTDASGYYTMTGLLEGSYAVEARDDDNTPPLYGREFYPDAHLRRQAQPVNVQLGQVIENINFPLDPGGTIRGRITDSQSGQPVAYQIIDIENGWWGTCTDAQGYYEFVGVAYDSYYIVAASNWNWCLNQSNTYIREYYDGVYDFNQATPVVVDAGNPERTGIDIALEVGGQIKGRVTAQDGGAPLAGIDLNANEYDNKNYGNKAQSDSQGYYTIGGLPPGDYRVEARDNDANLPYYAHKFYNNTYFWDQAQRVNVTTGGTAEGIDLALEPGGRITGQILDQDTGQPIPDICVGANSIQGGIGEGTCANSQGQYELNGLPFGEYEVYAGGSWTRDGSPGVYAQEYYQEQVFRWDATPVPLTLADPLASDIDFTLEKGGFIAGNVSDAQGAPLANIYLQAEIPVPGCDKCTERAADARSDAAGNYQLGPLPSLQAAVFACPGCDGMLLYNKYYPDALSFFTAELITVTAPNTTSGIDLTLDEGVLVNGDISVPAGYSKKGINIDVWRNNDPWYNTWAQTDADGHYVASVPPINDDYWTVRAIPRGTDLGGVRIEWSNLVEQPKWDFNLVKGSTISGVITDNGQPVPDAYVDAWSYWFGEGTNSDSQGNYTIYNLPAGGYQLQAGRWADYINSNYWNSPWWEFRPIEIESPVNLTAYDFEIQLLGQLAGHVYESDGSTPIEGAWIIALTDDNFWQAWSQPDGFYSMDLPEGQYKVLFINPDGKNYLSLYYPGKHFYKVATLVTVPPLSTGSLVLDQNLPKLSSLQGRVTDLDTDQPLGGMHVAVLNIDPAVGGEVAASTCTDGDGNYYLNNLFPGLTRVSVLGTCGNPDYNPKDAQLILQSGVDHTLDFSLQYAVQPKPPFTVWTYGTQDFTPLSYGGTNFSAEARFILPALHTPLAQVDDQGEWFSDLLTQVPTLANGGAQITNNQLTVTYSLKPDLQWSDGAPLTSQDIRFTWEMLTRPNPFSDGGWATVQPLWEIISIDLPDAQSAVVTFRQGEIDPNYLSAITYLLPMHVLSGIDPLDVGWSSHFAHYPVGNGPYIVENWMPGSHLDLTANPNYVRRGEGLPKINKLRLLFTGDPYHLLTTGQLDLVLDSDHNWDFKGTGAKTETNDFNGFQFLMPNPDLPFFKDPQARKALYMALDRPSLAAQFHGIFTPGNDYLPPNHPMRTNNLTSYSFNLAGAANLLDAAGWIDHDSDGIRDKDGVRLEFDLNYLTYSPYHVALVVMYQEDLATIGVDANLVGWDNRQDYLYAARHGKLDTYLTGWWYDFDFDPIANYLFHSRQIPSEYNGFNGSYFTGYWQNAANDALLESLREELNFASLKTKYAQHQTLWTAELPGYPVFTYLKNSAIPQIMTGFKGGGVNVPSWNIQEWYLPANPFDLSVRKSLADTSQSPQPGNTLTYLIQVTNLGFFEMTHPVVIDTLPGNVTYLSAIPAPTSVANGSLRWDLSNLPAKGSISILVNVKIPTGASHGETITNGAEVFADEGDTQPENNGFIFTLTVRDDIDLAVDKYGVGQPVVGEKYKYYINYGNQGGAPASSVTITDTLPAKVTFLSASPAPDSVLGNTLTWNLASLAGNQWGGQIQINTEIDSSGTITNRAGIQSPDDDANLANNQDKAIEVIQGILAPIITRPTSGVTDGTPSVRGQAPANSTVKIYDMKGFLAEPQSVSAPVLLATVTAAPDGAFQADLNLPAAGYILAATASKSGLTSGYSNNSAIVVNLKLPLDPDKVNISADGVDLSAGCVQAERYILAHRQLNVKAVINCSTAPDAHLRIIENGLLEYTSAPVALVDKGSGAWEVEFRTWLGEPHSTYSIWLEWECNGVAKKVLLLYILVDPDGYVYDKAMVEAGGAIENSLIMDAVVTAYVKSGDDWVIWPADLYNQFNPQVTDDLTVDGVLTPGYYSFLTPSGQYRLEASAPGYLPYQSPVLTVITKPVHLDIDMAPIKIGEGQPKSPAKLDGSYKSVDKTEAYVGQVLTVDIHLANGGQADSDPLTLKDPLPITVEYLAGTLSASHGSASYNAATRTIEWQGVVPGETTVHIQYQVKITRYGGGSDPQIVLASQVSGSYANLLTLPGLKVSTIQLDKVQYMAVVRRKD